MAQQLNRHQELTQCVIILRGGPAVGKTTIGKALRNKLGTAICISIDEIITMIGDFDTHSKMWGHIGSRWLADLYAKQGWFIIFEELYDDPLSLHNTQKWANQKKLTVFLFHLMASSEDAFRRNLVGGRDNISKERFDFLTDKVERSTPADAININTSEYAMNECVDIIMDYIQQRIE